MGSGRDKRRKAKGKKPGVGAQKTARKAELNDEKMQRRMERKAQGGEDDIDALLAKFQLESSATTKVAVINDVRPSARVYASFTALPTQKNNEILLFGGEWYDSDRDKMYAYADIFVLDVDKQRWRRVVTPGGPLPRSSHQAVATKHYLYVFGGEFTSLNQEKFKHYGDLWRLSLADWAWEALPIRGGPSARSGHRMALHRGRLLLFGGFWDAGREPRYYNDLWAFDLAEMRWECLGPPEHAGVNWPSPRGGCQLAVHGDLLYVIGGYSLLVSGDTKTASTNKRRGDGDEEDEEGKPVVHDDVWCYDLKAGTWERVRKAGMAPGPRTGFGLVSHRKRAVLFGGILDRAGARNRVYSELFNELYQLNLESRRWYPMALRPPPKKKGAEEEEERDAAEREASAPAPTDPFLAGLTPAQRQALDKAATRIQSRYRGYAVRKAYQAYKLGGAVSELLYSPALYGVDLGASADVVKPRARAAPLMAVAGDTLWLLGGIVEVARTDVVLDDLWSLNLAKLDGWTPVAENTAGEELKDLSDWETGSSSDDEDD